MSAKPRKPLLVNLAWATALVLLVAVGYVLSYAPVYRWQVGPDVDGFRILQMSGYGPVEWLMDNTALSKPLLWWGDVWGVGEKLRLDFGYGP